MLKGSEEFVSRDYYMYGDILKIVNMETKDVRSIGKYGV